jgi:hypothetical protein
MRKLVGIHLTNGRDFLAHVELEDNQDDVLVPKLSHNNTVTLYGTISMYVEQPTPGHARVTVGPVSPFLSFNQAVPSTMYQDIAVHASHILFLYMPKDDLLSHYTALQSNIEIHSRVTRPERLQ